MASSGTDTPSLTDTLTNLLTRVWTLCRHYEGYKCFRIKRENEQYLVCIKDTKESVGYTRGFDLHITQTRKVKGDIIADISRDAPRPLCLVEGTGARCLPLSLFLRQA